MIERLMLILVLFGCTRAACQVAKAGLSVIVGLQVVVIVTHE